MKMFGGIGLGTFPFAGPFGAIDKADASAIFQRYINEIGSYVHVAPLYADGAVEQFVGEEIKKTQRDKVILSTCCGLVKRDGDYDLSGKYQDVLDVCDISLKRLGVDYIDIYMSHGPDENTPYEETISAMEQLQKQGKVKELCVSNVTLEQLKRYNVNGTVKYVQNRYSLLNQNYTAEFVKYCRDNNIGIMAYQAVERGLLTNRFLNGFDYPQTDLRNRKPEFREEVRKEISAWVNTALLPIADKLNIPIATLVLEWTIANAEVDMCLVGISKSKYFSEYSQFGHNGFSSKDKKLVDEAYGEFSRHIMDKYGISVAEFTGIVNE